MKLSLNTRSSNPDWNGHMDCAVVDVIDRYHNGRGVSVMWEAVPKHSSTTVETVDIENRATSRAVRQSQPTEAARMNAYILVKHEPPSANAPDGSTWPARPGADTIEMLSLLYERFTPDEKADRHALSIDEP